MAIFDIREDSVVDAASSAHKALVLIVAIRFRHAAHVQPGVCAAAEGLNTGYFRSVFFFIFVAKLEHFFRLYSVVRFVVEFAALGINVLVRLRLHTAKLWIFIEGQFVSLLL